MQFIEHLRSLKGALRVANRHPFGQRMGIVCDCMSLYFRKGLDPEEYQDYDFHNADKTFRDTFLGLNEQRYYLDFLNPIKYYTLARNKFLAHKIMEDTGIQKSTLYCYYQPEGHVMESGLIANDLEGVCSLLKEKEVRACVIKATESSHGDSVFVVDNIEYQPHDCVLTYFNGKQVLLSEVLGSHPLIFESVVRQTRQLSSFNASSINTVRFMTALYPDGHARLVATFIKIGRAGRCVDNAGSGGNVDACIDMATGELQHVIQFDGWGKVKDITHHPDSGTLLSGVRIENWESIVGEVLKFQECMPYVKVAGWDIAITDEGPVVIEVNDFWDRTGQLFIRRGWREEIRDCYEAWRKAGATYRLERQPNRLSPSMLTRITKRQPK